MIARVALGTVPDWILAVTSLLVAMGALYAYFSRKSHEAFADATQVEVGLDPTAGRENGVVVQDMAVTINNKSRREIVNVSCVVVAQDGTETGRQAIGSISVNQVMIYQKSVDERDRLGATPANSFGSTATVAWKDSDGRRWSKDNWGTLRRGRDAKLPKPGAGR